MGKAIRAGDGNTGMKFYYIIDNQQYNVVALPVDAQLKAIDGFQFLEQVLVKMHPQLP